MQITIEAADTIFTLAAKHLGNSALWRELAELNELDVLSPLTVGATIDIPNISSVINKATPVLNNVSAGLNSASKQLDTFADVPVLGGYAKEAVALIDSLNGVVGKATLVLGDIPEGLDGNRSYDGSTRLVDWLLQ